MRKFIPLYLIFIFLLPLSSIAQNKKDYAAEWKKVEAAEKKDLPRTAWKEAKNIYALAASDGNEQQQIKALIHQYKYRDAIEENGLIKNIHQTDSLAQNTSGVVRSLLQNLSANLYLGYLHQNRYRILHRTYATNETREDVSTWSLPHLYHQIDSLFQQSLQTKTKLQQIKIKNYLILIDSGEHSLQLRPTLYDVLAHDALSFYTSGAHFLEQPAKHFVINTPVAFAPAPEFSKYNWQSTDSVSPTLNALKLYQQLIRFHLKDGNKEALVDVDLDRIDYVFQNSISPDDDSLYKRALEHIISRYAIAAKYKATALLARWYYNRGNLINHVTKKPLHPWALKKALAICKKVPEDVINKGTIECRQIKDRILSPSVSLNIENVNIPGKPFRALVSYKNLKILYFRIVKLTDKPKVVYNQRLSLSELSEKEIVTAWDQEFPLPEDYQTHAAEMKIEALPSGRYALIASMDSTLVKDSGLIGYVPFHVSEISYVSDNNGGFLVLNRASGKPIKDAKVRLWKRHYDQKLRKIVLIESGKYKTDKEGFIQTKSKETNYVIPEITTDDDHLFLPKGAYIFYNTYNTSKEIKPQIRGELFTDRAIYRPGQMLHFKGIVFKQSPEARNNVIKNKNVKIFLYDANYSIIDSASFTSNAYGSFAGVFQLPSASMNGRMHISIDSINTSAYFRVEEYKRPTFDLKWDSVAMNYRLGDSIPVTGMVMSYNGVPVNNAEIKYQVTRKRYYIPYFRSYRPSIFYPVQSAVVAQGKIQSDNKGTFSVTFPALPDESIPEGQRIFNYEVAVDVTDINGESHHYSYMLPVGDKSLILQLDMQQKVSEKQLDSLNLISTDLNGKFIPVRTAISLLALKSPGRFIRNRYWKQPDQYLMDQETFHTYFPHDEYKNEGDIKSREIARTVYVSTATTSEKTKIPFYHTHLTPGWYIIKVMAEDKEGKPVTDSMYIQVYDEKENDPHFDQVLWVNKNQLTAKPGQEVKWRIGSSENTYVFEKTEQRNKINPITYFKINHKIKTEEFKVENNDRGGIIRHYTTVRYNRFFSESVKIDIPRDNNHLKITYETFRNKILPGAKETWRVKITGTNNEKVNAELLASMYDASLDYFTKHNWSGFGNVLPALNSHINWSGKDAFSQEDSHLISAPEKKSFPKYTVKYPRLRNFGYNWKRRSGIVIRGRASLNKSAITGSVIVGYGKHAPAPQSKKDEVASSVRIESKDLANIPTANIEGLLQGKAAGLQADKPVQIRKNFRETAFFYPQLHTDDSGLVSFSFTAPEALTRWKLMLFAHTPDLKFAYAERETITQKPLMIRLNAPRFVRQGDDLMITAKVSNLTGETQSGHSLLTFKNTVTGKTIPLVHSDKEQNFSVAAHESKALTWHIIIPEDYTDALTYTIKAVSENHSDGAQDILPVLNNKTRITESLPLSFTGNGVHKLQWETLSKLQKEKADIQPERITIEYTANPIWYAVQALPFMDYTATKSASAVFRSVYANSLSRYVALKIPHFKDIMQQWLTTDTNALKSALQKNRELKNILLNETPWVKTAQTEAAQKSKIAEWYTQDSTQLRLKAAITALKQMQMNNGGFNWFKGMRDSRFITQEIIAGIGHLKNLHAWPHIAHHDLQQIVNNAIPYLDDRMKEEYDNLMESKTKSKYHITPTDIQYLYLRSFFPDIPLSKKLQTAFDYFYNKAAKEWTNKNVYNKAMLALTFYRNKDNETANAILKSLKETAIQDKLLGMYWKQPYRPIYWYQAPVSTQAICLEAFSTLNTDTSTINALRKWLLNQKKTQFWGTGKATANAVYALLLNGTGWTTSKTRVNIQIGDTAFILGKGKLGLQYEKVSIPKEAIQPDMKNIHISISGAAKEQPSWGAAYLQYFANMNQVDQNKGSGLQIERQISLETNTPYGRQLSPVSKATSLKVGDRVQVRLIVTAKRNMDFVHLKDVRASCMEPRQVLSGYQWQGGMGYYSTVSDAAVHFYFRHLPKGTYVLTYPVYITQKGNFTGGLSQIECLYAPEIRAHSEGISLQIK